VIFPIARSTIKNKIIPRAFKLYEATINNEINNEDGEKEEGIFSEEDEDEGEDEDEEEVCELHCFMDG
jgi:hypothetical protein